MHTVFIIEHNGLLTTIIKCCHKNMIGSTEAMPMNWKNLSNYSRKAIL